MAAMAAILDIGTEGFCNSESLCHCDASHQVSAQLDLRFGRRCRLKISRWPPWQPYWILEWHNFSNSESLCRSNASKRRSCLKNFKMAPMAAILDNRMERF